MNSLKSFIFHLPTRFTVGVFRLFAYVLHATGLDSIYKPRFTRHSALLDLDEAMVAKLPKYSQTLIGARMDPMNLVFVGSDKGIRLLFRRAGWHRAHPASPWHLLYGGVAAVLGKSYRTGPFMPQYLNIGLQDFAFQKLTKRKKHRERHHVRIWRTGMVLPGNQAVWVAAASYDTKIVFQVRPPFINHRIDPAIDREREFIAHDLERTGGVRLKYVDMTPKIDAAKPQRNATGMKYFTDGRAAVVEVPDVA